MLNPGNKAHLCIFNLWRRRPVQLRKRYIRVRRRIFILFIYPMAASAIAEMLNPGNKAYLYASYLWQGLPAHLYLFVFGTGVNC